jgi:hypothetical protein
MWGVLTVALFALGLVRMPVDFNALIVVIAMGVACIFGFSLSLTIGRWRQERDRRESQPLRH